MSFSLIEPIVAQITPPGTAAIAVIRISGKDCIELVAKHFNQPEKLIQAPGNSILHGYFLDEQREAIDEVLLYIFRAPKSYTGDDTVEISCHGNPRLAARILKTLLLSARLANPGEFTLRALHNGKLDLIQAEAVGDLINAPTRKGEAAALSQLRGGLSDTINELLEQIINLRMRCEMGIDFADQDLPPIDEQVLAQDLASLLNRLRQMIASAQHGRLIREGFRICLAGAPNSGKSSLFNAFLKQNRAIVTPHPGTTRDYLEESISLEGYWIILFDTAGLRESTDLIEQEGIKLSKQLMREADLVLYLVDASTCEGLPQPDNADKTLIVLSKADLVSPQKLAELKSKAAHDVAAASVKAEGGLDELYSAILSRLEQNKEDSDTPLVTNTRHLAALQVCAEALTNAQEALKQAMGFEFVAFDLIAASAALEEIIGLVSPDDLLNRIFSDFCIGK
ncbi:MAG: tRNA uridine-5-carboxymethylaminomethyl(34) synthesis GTPase MnmE [Candidatus Cloacimonadaceae bacterium]|jgi:tRNA modification GTPase